MRQSMRADVRGADLKSAAWENGTKLFERFHLLESWGEIAAAQLRLRIKQGAEAVQGLRRAIDAKVIIRIVIRQKIRHGADVIDMGMRDQHVSDALGVLGLPTRRQRHAQLAEATAAIEDQEGIERLHLDAGGVAAVAAAQRERQLFLKTTVELCFQIRPGAQVGEAVVLDQPLEGGNQFVGYFRRPQRGRQSSGDAPVGDGKHIHFVPLVKQRRLQTALNRLCYTKSAFHGEASPLSVTALVHPLPPHRSVGTKGPQGGLSCRSTSFSAPSVENSSVWKKASRSMSNITSSSAPNVAAPKWNAVSARCS